MAAKDKFHRTVKAALQKDQWIVTDDPLLIQFVDLQIDLGAEKLVAAEKNGEKIAVEIKSFLGPSIISDFHAALGQFLNYRLALEAQESNAVSRHTGRDLSHVLSPSLRTTRHPTLSPEADGL